MESLGTGKTFYLHIDSNVMAPTFKCPDFLKDAEVVYQKDVPKAKFAERPKSNWPLNKMRTVNVVMNSFDCGGEIENAKIYLWTVEFEPPVPDGPDRHKTVGGYSFNQRQQNRRKLKEKFGRYVIDNLMTYSEGVPANLGPGKAVEFPAGNGDECLNANHLVRFTLSEGPIQLTDEGLTYEQCEQILNVFTRDMMEVAGYDRLHNSAFYRKKNTPTEVVASRTPGQPGLKIMKGFEANIKVTADSRKPYKFKVDLTNKLLWEDTLHTQIMKMKAKAGSMEDLKRKCSKFIGKFFVLSYGSKRSERVENLDWEKNQDSVMNPGEPNQQTYRQYFENKYKINASKPEMCVVTTRNGNCFLPQHINFTAISSECAELYEQAMMKMTPHIQQRMNSIQSFIEEIKRSKASLQPTDEKRAKMIEIDSNPIQVKAVTFDPPKLVMRTKNGGIQAFPLRDFKPKTWGMNTGGILNPTLPNGKEGKITPMPSLGLLYGEREMRAGQGVKNCLSKYINKRGFRTGNPWPRITEVQCNWRGANNQFAKFLRTPNGKYLTHAIVVIPEGTEGSEIKTRLTKQAQMSRRMTTTMLQFVRVSCATNDVKVMGALENLLTKSGYCLYRIDPDVPPPILQQLKLVRPGRAWHIGLDVSHNGTSKPSVCTLAISRDVFSGSLASVHHSVWLNPPRKEVIGYQQMIGFFHESLAHIWKVHIKKKTEKTLPIHINALPEVLYLFRDGLSEGQLHESLSKEYNGIQRACREFAKNQKIKVKNDKGKLAFWKPKIQFIVIQKRILDRIGVRGQRGLENPRDAVVVFDTCLEKKLWDFVAWFNTRGKNRPLRYIVLKDDLGIAKDHDKCLAFFKVLYATTYLYPFSLPFTMGNVNQPGVVKLAKHYSELWSQMIFKADTSLDALETNPNFNRPHLFFRGAKD